MRVMGDFADDGYHQEISKEIMPSINAGIAVSASLGKGSDQVTTEQMKHDHKNIHAALAAAQMEMGPVVKGSTNPHFKSKYADLADVVSVALPSLNANGIALFHQIVRIENEQYMRTILAHGGSETEMTCDVPLIVAGNNMQAFKSATTYAKRIGVESLTGIAPEDDDGNAAASAPPTEKPKAASKGVDARKTYDALVTDIRRCDTVADCDAWWLDSDSKALRAQLPLDWLESLKDEFRAHKAALAAKVEVDNRQLGD